MTATKDDGTTEGLLTGRWVDVLWHSKVRHVRLVVVDPAGHELEAGVADDYCRMRDHAARDGHVLHLNTATREREHQQRLYDAWLRYNRYRLDLEAWREAGSVGSPPKKVDWAPKAAPPGLSTHEIGCSGDLERMEGDDPKTPAPDSPLDRWLDEHAHEYGFTRDVKAEPWHVTHLATVARILAS